MLKALSGTSMLFSSLKVILQEMHTIPFSLKSQLNAMICHKLTWKKLKMFMKKEDMVVKDTKTFGTLKKLKKTF